MAKIKFFVALFLFVQINCGTSHSRTERGGDRPMAEQGLETPEILIGAARMEAYIPLISGKKIALIVNQTSMVGQTHLVDTLLAQGISIQTIFSPEHGFRGEADAGEKLTDSTDPRTGLPLVSLYGKKRKPAPEDLAGLDWVIFDIQDVGVRYYTYISTMHYAMEACAENGVGFMVLDRPNPNGHYVDGPILDMAYRSFVGMHPVPVVHGMTIGEYARMINGEGWLENGVTCRLTVISCENYTHATPYSLPVPPSPNLPNMRSIYLYPSTCLFEGTTASEGRGTNTQFQVYGHPDFKGGDHIFLPVSQPGAQNPKHKGQLCYGYDLTKIDPDSIRARARVDLHYLIDFYRDFPDKEHFFLPSLFFDKLAGGATLREQVIAGRTGAEIRAGWQTGLEAYRQTRQKYLLYPE